VLVSLEGEEATGKTTCAYTAPRKVVGLSFDMGAHRAIYGAKYEELFQDSKIQIIPYAPAPSFKPAWDDYDITIYELLRPIQMDNIRVSGCIEVWSYFTQLFVAAMTDPAVRSIVIDTMTVARRVRVDAHLEALQNMSKQGEKMRERLQQIEYGRPNDAIRDAYFMSQGLKKNLVAIHHLTDEYGEVMSKRGEREQVATGKRVLEGLSQTYRFVDVAVRMEKANKQLSGVFVKCGYNLDLEGQNIFDPTWDRIVTVIEMSLGDRIKLERRNDN